MVLVVVVVVVLSGVQPPDLRLGHSVRNIGLLQEEGVPSSTNAIPRADEAQRENGSKDPA